MKMKTQQPKTYAKGKVHSHTGIPQETRKKSNNNLILHLKQLVKEEMKNPRVSRRKEILKTRAEINAKEIKETIAKVNKAKSWFFERTNKIDKPLARLIKKQREKNHINKIRSENGEITTDNTEIQRIIRDYYGIWSHHFMGNRWGNSGNSVRLYFSGLQNHCRW